LKLAEEAGYHLHAVAAKSSLAHLHSDLGNVDSAATQFDEALAKATEIGARDQLPEIYRGLAQVRLARRDLGGARQHAEQAVALAAELGIEPERGVALGLRAVILHKMGQWDQAEIDFEDGLRSLGTAYPYERARIELAWAEALASGNQGEAASALLKQVQAAFRKLGAQRDLERAQREWSSLAVRHNVVLQSDDPSGLPDGKGAHQA
jgi:tetratricopeptide (TPR) repeat protein